jgi:hypothetical protein
MTVDGSNLFVADNGQNVTESNGDSNGHTPMPLDHKVRFDKVASNRIDGCSSNVQYAVGGGPFKGVIVNKVASGEQIFRACIHISKSSNRSSVHS